MSNSQHQIQTNMENEVKELQNLQREMQKYAEGRQKLIEQQNESELVKKEFDILEEGSTIFKLIGQVLIQQSLSESKVTIDKRLEFINGEIKRLEGLIKENEIRQIQKRNIIQKLQEDFYRATQAQQKQ